MPPVYSLVVSVFFDNKYVSTNKLEERWVKLLDHYRETRHDDQYSTYFIATESEAKSSLDFTKSFIKRMESLLENI